MKIRNLRDGTGDGELKEVAESVAEQLPAGSDFLIIALLPGGRGRFAASGEPGGLPGLVAAARAVLDAVDARCEEDGEP